MTEKELSKYLEGIVKANSSWSEDFERLTVYQNPTYVELSYNDSGAGEEYVVQAFQKAWPDRFIDSEAFGGCDSCGYGRSVSITISGKAPWA